MIEKYYEEELQYLYESGKEFAKAHPDLARFLNIDAVGDRDPYVERLFEGFAFLAGRIREKLDDSFPELSEGLVNLMWPNFLRDIPSLAIMELRPRKGALQESRTIDRGAEVLSGAVGPELTTCKFITTQPVRLNPITLAGLDRSVDTKGRETLSFRFQLDAGVSWQKLSLEPIRLYLHAEMPTALMLHQFMTKRVIQASINIDNSKSPTEIDAKTAVTAGGLSATDSLLPQDSRSFWGYMLLLEYFVYPEKFLFIDIHGFDKIIPPDPPPERFTVSLMFDTALPHNRPFRADNFRLFCTPAINLFKQDTEPVYYNGKRTEYRIIADSHYPHSVQAHSIISVSGMDRATGERSSYAPYYAFETRNRKLNKTFAVHYQNSAAGKKDLYVSIGGEQLVDGQVREESLSIEAFCTNGNLPREEIRENSITNPGAGFPDYVKISNITRSTLPCPPPDAKDYLWVFLSHLGTTFTSLSSPENLKALLRLYEWSRSEGRGRRIDAIAEVSLRPAQASVNGSVIRGIEYTVGLTEAAFTDIGDLHLFGEVLKEFLSNYVTINSFLQLVFILKPSGARLRWDTIEGKRWPI